jgi:hypothetical protein
MMVKQRANELSAGIFGIQLSCPDCNRIVTTEMFLETDDMIKLPPDISQFISTMIGVTKHYCFNGRTKCECGKIVMGCLNRVCS